MKGYITLGLAIAGELVGTSMLKLSYGFTNILPSIGFILGMGAAFYFISISLRYIPLGTAYAIWSGVGTAFATLIGIWVWKEAFSLPTVIGIALIVGGIVILNSAKISEEEVVEGQGN